MSLSDSKAILSKLSKTTVKKPVVAPAVANLLNACHKGVIDALRELKETNPDAFFRMREEANAKPVRTLLRRPTKVVVEPKKGDESEFYCDRPNHEDTLLQHDGDGGYYCGDCDNECDDESDEEDEWMEVYTHSMFGSFCGEHEHLQPYKDFRYYQCWGGGPEGGYIVCGDTVCRVNRSWGEPFSVERVEGIIDVSEGECLRIRILTHLCEKCYDISQMRSYVLLAGAKVEKRGDLMWVILRDDENWMANKSLLQDNAFDYAKCKKDGIWDFHDHPHYGCFTFSKK